MIKSVYRDIRHSIKLVETLSAWSYAIRYYPMVRERHFSTLASIYGYDNGRGTLILYPDTINDVPGDQLEITQLIVKYINQAYKHLEIKSPPLTLGFYKNKYGSTDFRLCYHRHQVYVIDNYYSYREEEPGDLAAIGIQLAPYTSSASQFKSYTHMYWFDPHNRYNGLVYFIEKHITPEVARDILLHQVEYRIKLSSFLKKKLDDDGKMVINTAINLLKIKGVA